jgi:predicted ABC-type sugar transport system permease subunit
VNLIRSAVFGIGCGLAGIGGVLAAPLVTASVGMAATMIIDAFVIVIIGGMGSFPGSVSSQSRCVAPCDQRVTARIRDILAEVTAARHRA